VHELAFPKGKSRMKTHCVLANRRSSEKDRDLVTLLRILEEECTNCAPLTPLECISRCNIWKLKNELRRLHETMANPNFMKDLLNVLKNGTRLQILKKIVRAPYSVCRLQQELKKMGHLHSQYTIVEWYLRPLLEVGLATEMPGQYRATTFGSRLTELIEDPAEMVNFLPAHSECHEENMLKTLLSGPRTFADINELISQKIASRILKRLKTASLIETPEKGDYIFFFRSRRDPSKGTFSSTESKVYDSIPNEGISARKLAEKTELAKRTTYKHLRRLKGKKLIFTRKNSKAYCLTMKGQKLALVLHELHNLIKETMDSSEQVIKATKTCPTDGESKSLLHPANVAIMEMSLKHRHHAMQ
jgi:DNA-binding transcriptional ArsR family regulator